MAKLDIADVPQIRSAGVEVGPGSQYPVSGSSNVDAILDGSARVAHGLGKLTAHFQAERQKANAFVAGSKELDFAAEASDLLYNAESGFLTRQGVAAMDTADVHDQIEAARQRYLAELPNEEARQEFDLRTRVRSQAYADTVERHAAAQRHKVYGEVAETARKRTVDDAVAVYNHPEKVDLMIGLALDPKGPLMTYVRDQGLKPEQVEQFVKEFSGEVYVAVLGEYRARQQFQAGREYLAQVAPVLGAKATPWTKEFNDLTEKARVEALSTSAWQTVQANATDPVSKRFNPVLARQALTELYTPEDRALIETEVEKEIAVETAAQAERDVQAIARLEGQILSSGRFSRQTADFLNLDDEGQTKIKKIEQAHIRSLRQERSAERAIQNTLDEISVREFRGLDPDVRAAKTDAQLRSDYPDASPLGLAKLKEARQAAQISVKNKTTASSRWFAGEVARIAVDMTPSFSKALRAKMTEWYDSYLLTNQKEPTEQEALTKLAEAITLYDVPWGGDRYGYELPADHTYEPADEQTFDLARQRLVAPQRVIAPTQEQGPMRKKGSEIDPSLPPDMMFEWDAKNGEWTEVR